MRNINWNALKQYSTKGMELSYKLLSSQLHTSMTSYIPTIYHDQQHNNINNITTSKLMDFHNDEQPQKVLEFNYE